MRELPATMRVLDELTTSYDVADDAQVSAALTTCRAEFALASATRAARPPRRTPASG
ncbi:MULTISPECIES: hypothetical protein [Streptomyces]|uniref:hypothetical protein n=1 Tax=Streptomyces TaxID=1883 RepID=UPI00240D3A32|nr:MULTISPECIES: hypothetical protein [Streptomyces]WFB81813.1 hypothetical protein MMU79_00020 [Streptomyces olivaceus]WGK44148.1 hypothetical protein M6G09_00245 [Streptomyces sp. B146]